MNFINEKLIEQLMMSPVFRVSSVILLVVSGLYIIFSIMVYLDVKYIELKISDNDRRGINLNTKSKIETVFHHRDSYFQRKKKEYYQKINQYILITNIKAKTGGLYTLAFHLFISMFSSILLTSLFVLIINSAELLLILMFAVIFYLVPTLWLGAYSYFVIADLREKLPVHLQEWGHNIDHSENYLEALENVITSFPKNLKAYFKGFFVRIERGEVTEAYQEMRDIFYLIPKISRFFSSLEEYHYNGKNPKETILFVAKTLDESVKAENEVYRELRLHKLLEGAGIFWCFISIISLGSVLEAGYSVTSIGGISVTAFIMGLRIILGIAVIYFIYDVYSFFLLRKRA